MAKFVVAKINFMDNELNQSIIDFEGSLLECYINQAENDGIILENEEASSINEIKQCYFNCDSMISIIELSNEVA